MAKKPPAPAPRPVLMTLLSCMIIQILFDRPKPSAANDDDDDDDDDLSL